MPKSPYIKGKPGPFKVRERLNYDPVLDQYTKEEEWHGTVKAVNSLAGQSRVTKSDTEVTSENGIGVAIIRYGQQATGDAPAVRYEIGLETLENEIWTHPTVISEARTFDATPTSVGDGETSYRGLAEAAVTDLTAPTLFSDPSFPSWGKVVKLLRDGVTGWEKEYIVLRRSRRIPNYIPITGPSGDVLNVGTTQYIYSTSQLGIPNGVSFAVPNSDNLDSPDSDYVWGWRRRPGQLVFEGQWIEQSSEFILAEWSTLLYTNVTQSAGISAGW